MRIKIISKFYWLVLLSFHLPSALANDSDGAADLSSMGLDDYTPYIVERNRLWILLPLFAATIVLLHLKKNKRKPETRKEKS